MIHYDLDYDMSYELDEDDTYDLDEQYKHTHLDYAQLAYRHYA